MYRYNYFRSQGVGDRAASFVRSWNPSFHPALRDAVQTFLAGMEDPVTAPGLYLWGPPGTGKTVTALWITQQTPLRWRITTDRNLLSDYRRTLDPQANECSRDGWLHDFFSKKAFFLDDLCSSPMTAFETGVLHEVLDRLYQLGRPTLFTSNHSLPELSQRLGDRIASRLSEMATPVPFSGPDLRIA